MPIEEKELEKILKEFYGLIKEGAGIGVAAPASNQPSLPLTQPSQQPISNSPSDSKSPKEKAWEDFFNRNGIDDLNIQQKSWKDNSGLTPDEAQQVWDNGWKSLTLNIANLGNKQVSYTKNNKITDNVKLLEHKKEILDKVYDIMRDIESAKLSSELLKDDGIESYDENLVPESRNHKALKGMRDGKAKELFKKGFGSDISDDEINAWKKTGLGGDGTNERKASDNGWIEPEKIRNGKLKEDNSVDVLKHNKNEIDKASDIIKEIKATTTFKQIDDWKTNNEERVKKLVDSKLPASKQQNEIWTIFTNHRNTFKYYLNVKDNEVENDGLTEQELTDAREKLKEENRWKSKEFNPLTADILNKLFGLEGNPDNPNENLNTWLKGQRGYKIDTEPSQTFKVAKIVDDQFTGVRGEITLDGSEVIRQEEEWTKKDLKNLQGAYLLPLFYNKNGGFDPGNLKNSDGSWNESMFAKIGDDGEIDKTRGTLAIGTGVGKTTKTVNCILDGGKNNVILVCPEESLVNDAFNHHRGWLQQTGGVRYKCVVHGVDHGKYNTELNNLIYYEDRSDKNNVVKGGEKGLSILEAKKLLGYMARSAVQLKTKEGKVLITEPSVNEKKNIEKEREKMPTLKLNDNLQENIAEIKKRCISKEDTIIIFDEAHYNDAKYQEIQKQIVKNGYKVLLMSATFPGVDFSITTSHPRDVYLTKKFQPEYLKDEDDNFLLDEKGNKIEKWSKQKTAIFLPNTEDEFEVDEVTGKKKAQTKWGGLTKAQRDLLDDEGISYVILDKSNSAAATGITEGMDEGTAFFFSPAYEMGFSPDCHNVIVSGFTQLTTLGKGKSSPWIYGKPQELPLPIASLVQQIGRVARRYRGWAYVLSNVVKEIKPSEDLSYKFVAAIMSGSLVELNNSGISNMGKSDDKSANFLRASVALPYKFGYDPEEILVGLRGRPVGDNKMPSYPTYGNKPTVVDEELWNKHLGKPTPPKIDKERSEQIILIIIMTFLKNQADITENIDVSFSNPLIKDVWGKEVPKTGKKSGTEMVLGEEEKNKVIKEVRKVLHTVIDKHRKGLKGYKESKDEYLATEKYTFDTLVKLYRVVDKAEIKVETLPDKEKTKTNISIIYMANEQTSKKSIEFWEEIGTWRCHRCLKMNNGYRFCEECGIDVRLDKKAKEKNELTEELKANIEVKR